MEINETIDLGSQIFTPWEIFNIEPGCVTFEGITYDSQGMKINLREDNGELRGLSLIFSTLPTAIRIANESLRLTSLSLLPKHTKSSFFLVENSEFLTWLNRESLEIYKNDPIFHLAIVTDEWIDLICNDTPEVKFF